MLTLPLAGSLLVGAGSLAMAQSQAGLKCDRFLAQTVAAGSKQGWTNVIARFDGEPNESQQAQLKALGADVYRHLPIIHSAAMAVPARNLSRLAALPFVKRLSADLTVIKNDEFTVESSGADIAFQQNHLTGANIRVAVVDSGIHNMPDFGNQPILGLPNPLPGPRIAAQINFVPGSHGTVNPADADDKCGHGTHIAGIIAGNGANSSNINCYRTFYGIARQAGLVNVRVLDANGQSTVSTVIAGLQWVIANKAKHNIRILNLSMGHPVGESYTTDPLCQAVESAWQAGIVVVCAAGNAGRIQNTPDPSLDNEGYGANYGSIMSPGNDPYVITVGAMKATDMVFQRDGTWTHTRANDRVATYSSRGPSRLDLVLKPDIMAPGNRVISVDSNNSTLDNYAGNTNDIRWTDYMRVATSNWSPAYFRLSGTSMAAPVVAGAAALMLQQDPTLNPDTIKARLMLSADKWSQPDGTMDPCTFGAGYLDIPAALKCKAVPNQSAMSPSLSQDADGNVYINLDRAIWGTDSINGARAVWGISGVYDLRAVWGTRAIWGTTSNLLDASRAIWGTNVWYDRAMWGTNFSGVDLSSTAINGE